jgi:hypothetical protein
MLKSKIRPYNFVNGGLVKNYQISIPKEILEPGDKDRVFARLMEGEIVIPTKYVDQVTKFLKENNIKLPNM